MLCRFSTAAAILITAVLLIGMPYRALAQREWSRIVGPSTSGAVGISSIATEPNGDVVGARYGDDGMSLVRYSSLDGGTVWQTNVAGAAAGMYVATDPLGDIYVAAVNGPDFGTYKFSPSGSLLWHRTLDDPQNAPDTPVAIRTDSNGDVFVTGYCNISDRSRDTFNTQWETFSYDAAGDLKYESRHVAPTKGYSYPTALAVDSAGHAIVTGVDLFGPSLNYTDEIETIEYDTNGSVLWGRAEIGPVAAYPYPNEVAVDATGNVFVAGEVYIGKYFEAGETIKYNSTGHKQWGRFFSVPGHNFSLDVSCATDSFGDVVVGAASYENSFDWHILKYDPDGNLVAHETASNAPGFPAHVAVDAAGDIIAAGALYGGPLNDAYAYLVAKYDNGLKNIWHSTYRGTNDGTLDVALAVAPKLAIDAEGDAYLLGYLEEPGSNADASAIVKFGTLDVAP